MLCDWSIFGRLNSLRQVAIVAWESLIRYRATRQPLSLPGHRSYRILDDIVMGGPCYLCRGKVDYKISFSGSYMPPSRCLRDKNL